MQCFTFTVPVKTYIKKYLLGQFGDPLIINLDTDIGFLILTTITSRLEAKACKGLLDNWKKRYNDSISFKIPFHYFSLSKKQVSPTTYALLNRYFENKFKEDMCRYVDDRRGLSDKKIIELFIQQYDIVLDEDISVDALLKSEYRLRQKITKKSGRILSNERTMVKC